MDSDEILYLFFVLVLVAIIFIGGWIAGGVAKTTEVNNGLTITTSKYYVQYSAVRRFPR
jgi:exopolysaccharide biosynthesis protein